MKSSAEKFILVIVLLLWSVGPVCGAEPYKVYSIIRYGDRDIVCDSYIVQKGDHVWELLRRKGIIAEKDFSQFVSILENLNPHVKDVDKIYPRQELLIPLKQTEAKEHPPDAGLRYVTIPIIPDVLYVTYEVRPGECLAKIVTSQLGLKWDELSEDYVQTLKRLNPAIKDMDLIHPGQPIRIPEIAATASTRTVVTPTKRLVLPAAESLPPAKKSIPWWREVVSKTIAGIGGKLLASGLCYFPESGQEDLTLDLSALPVMELADGRHLILESHKGLSEDLEKAIRAFWHPLVIVRTDPEEPGATTLAKVFSAISGGKAQRFLDLAELYDGMSVTLRADWIFSQTDDRGGPPAYECITLIEDPQERTSAQVVKYLAKKNIRVVDILVGDERDNKMKSSRESAPEECPILTTDAGQEAFVSGFVTAMGYSYESRVPLSFDYAGVQVETTANIMHGENALDVVVDFGTFYGDAKPAIEAGGLKVVSIKPEDDALTIVKNILRTIGIPFAEDPVFFGANRNVFKSTSFAIPGVLSSHPDQGRTLFARARLHPKVCGFLNEKQIKVLKIKPQSDRGWGLAGDQ